MGDHEGADLSSVSVSEFFGEGWGERTSIPTSEMIVSCEESFYSCQHQQPSYLGLGLGRHTALTSARFPHLAKCALKLAFAAPPATPHNALNTPAALNTLTRIIPLGTPGLTQSSTIATSLNTSAASRYRLHSGSRAVPARCAKRIVARRPDVSCNTCRRRALVGEAVALPTPTPGCLV